MLRTHVAILVVLACAISLAAQERVTVSAQTVLRGTPDPAGEVITTLESSEGADLMRTRGDWHLVQTGKYVGWVETSAVTMNRVTSGPGGGMGTGPGTGRSDGARSRPNPSDKGAGAGKGQAEASPITTRLRILSKPNAGYTTPARDNKITGTVVLRVTFLETGAIGAVRPVKGLPFGLTEQAVNAAKGIRFEPAKRNGVPTTVTMQIEYTFNIY